MRRRHLRLRDGAAGRLRGRILRLPLIALAACRIEVGAPDPGPVACDDDAAGEVWLYTSVYPHVAEAIEALVRAEHGAIELRTFQAGSEKVAQRIEAEWAAGSSPACVLLTSDPFWYAKIAAEGRLRPHLAPTVLRIDRTLVDPDGLWTTARLSLAVLAVNGAKVPSPPRSFADLAAPEWRDRVTMPDPLASGSAFTVLAFLLRDGGWPLVEGIEANGLVAAGGNSAVLARVETAERPVGVVLLENLLSAEGTPAVPVFPDDGAVLVPGPIAVPAGCPNPAAAGAVVDLLLSERGQALMVAGDMYAALPGLPAPDGAPALDAIRVRPWPPGFAAATAADAAAFKDRWARVVAR